MGELGDLLDARAGEALDLHAEYANPQMIRVLRTIGFDRDWARTEGAYLYDAAGERYLDWLGGVGVVNRRRSHPRGRGSLGGGRGRATPNAPRVGVPPGAALPAQERRRPAPPS